MHHNQKVDAPSGTALLLGRAAAEGRGIDLDRTFGAQPRRPYRRAQGRRYRLCHSARRHRGRRAQRDLRGPGRAHRADAQGRGPHDLRARRVACGAVGAQPEAGTLFDDGRSWDSRWTSEGKANDRPSSRTRAPWPERLESEEPVHRLARRRPDRKRCRGSARSRPQAQGAGNQIRCRFYLGAQARAAHARPDAHENWARRQFRCSRIRRSTNATMAILSG